MSLPHRKLGPFSVSSVILGCMNLSHAYGQKPKREDAIRLLNRALDLGVDMLDTAALYGMGTNEELVAEAVGHRADEYVLASKCVLFAEDGKRQLDGRPATIARVLEGSLKRLNRDCIDLLYLHRLDMSVPIEDSVGALADAKAAGKIRHIGLSEVGAETIRRAHAVSPVAVVQSEYSPTVRNPEVAVLDTCAELGIGFAAFSPLARGLLADAIRSDDYVKGDLRTIMPRFCEPLLTHNLKAVDRFNALARSHGLTPARLSIAWVLAQAKHVVALPGTRSLDHLEEDVAAAHETIEPSVVEAVNEIFDGDAIRGPRYPARSQEQIDTELLPGEKLENA